MFYRLYQPEDFAPLYAIEEACFSLPDRFSRAYLRKLLRKPNGAAWVAVDGETFCGFGIVEWFAAERCEAYIQTLEVIVEARGRGVGGELLKCLEKSAIEAGVVLIQLHVDAQNTAAIGLYERNGYQLQGRQENYYGRGRAALGYAKVNGA